MPAVFDNAVPVPAKGRRTFPLGLILVAGGFLYAFGPVLASFVRTWMIDPTFSYGFYILPLSGYLVWVKRKELAAAKIRNSFALGLPLIAASLLLLVAGRIGSMVVLEQIAFLVAVPGVVLTLFGPGFFRKVWFPVAFLVFMIPFLHSFVANFHYPFQLFSARFSTALIRLMGIPAHMDGTRIFLPGLTLEVAEACSGLNFVISLVVFGFFVLDLFLHSWKRKSLLLVLSVSVALVSNSLRIALIAVAATLGLSADIHGPYHVLYGTFISFIGFIVLFLGIHILRKKEKGYSSPEKEGGLIIDGEVWQRSGWVSPAVLALTASFVLAGAYAHAYRSSPVEPAHSLAGFPDRVAGLTGADVPPPFPHLEGLESDYVLSRRYAGEGRAGEVFLYIRYLEYQDQGRELVNYLTDRLLEGSKTERLVLDTGEVLTVNRSAVDVGGKKYFLLSWYETGGRTIANRYLLKARTVLDGLLRRQTAGAMVIVAETLPPGAVPGSGMNPLGEFVLAVRSLSLTGRI